MPNNNSLNSGGIIGWFANNSVAANLLMLIVIVMGYMEMGTLRREAFPAMQPDTITIAVTYKSGSAKQSEESIAMKIEDSLQDVSGIKSVESKSTTSGATVTIEKKSDYDLNTLLEDVRAKVDSISNFPADAYRPVIEAAKFQQTAVMINLYGDSDRHTLQTLAYDLKQDLMENPKINLVTIEGWVNPMMVIEVNEGMLQAYGLKIGNLETAINAASSTPLTATLQSNQLYLQLKASKQAYLQQDFAKIPLITDSNGNIIKLGDVAKIRDTFDESDPQLLRFQGKDSILLEVFTTDQDDVINTVKAANSVVKKWQDTGRLPTNVKIASWDDGSESITSRLQLLVKNALSGAIVVFLLLALFLNLTVAFWVAMGLPFIFFGTMYLMGPSFFDLSLNSFTTFGFIMALGIVVDDAVVVGESIYSQRRAHGDTLANTVSGTLKVAVPTLFGAFTTVVAFYALSQTQGRLGQLYAQFAYIIAICLLFSLVESKLILPSHLAHLNTHKKPSTFLLAEWWRKVQMACDGGLNWFKHRIYTPVIKFSLIHRYAMIVMFSALFILVISMPFTGLVKISFFPDIPRDNVEAQVKMQHDATFGQTVAVVNKLEKLAYQTDEKLRHGVGQNAIKTLIIWTSGVQEGQIYIELNKGAPYSIQTFTREWRKSVGKPDGARTVSIESRRTSVDSFKVQLQGNDLDLLVAAGKWLKSRLKTIPGVSGIEDNLDPKLPQLKLVLSQQGHALGMTTQSLATQILQAFNGQIVQRYQRNNDEIEVKVRYPEANRQTVNNVLQSYVRTPSGDVVPLQDVATVSYGYARNSIRRYDYKRGVYIRSDVDKNIISATALVNTIQKDLEPELKSKFPGVELTFKGEAEQQQETESSMEQLFLAAMIGIYMLLAIPLKSYRQPVLIMMAIPFGVVGAILGHWFMGLQLSILSFNGIIALSGVVVNDSLLLASTYNEISKDKPELSLAEALILTCQSRMRAVLLTSFTTFGGLAPLLFETSFQAQFLIPAAVSLAYGIMFATLITLVLMPALLMINEDLSGFSSRVKQSLLPAK